MANYYVRSTDGNDADGGTTWALAKATIAGAIAIPPVSGDTIWTSQVHAEAIASQVFTLPAGVRILCGNDGAEPPTALATTATSTSSGSLDFRGSGYVYGIAFSHATAGTLDFGDSNATHRLVFDNSKFILTANSSAADVVIGNASAQWDNFFHFISCSFKFPNAGSTIVLAAAQVVIQNMSLDAAGTIPTTLFTLTTRIGVFLIEASDLSDRAFTNLVALAATQSLVIFRACKIPASINVTTGTGPATVWMDNCDSGDTNYRFSRTTYEGSVVQDTGTYKSGGASDGTTPLSWKMVSSANTLFWDPLESGEIVFWNETTGSAVAVGVEVVTDNVTLTDADAWIEVMALTTLNSQKTSLTSDRAADIIATPVNQATSSVTWTGAPGTPVKQRLEASVTPQEKGWILARVMLAKPSTTMYVDPVIAAGSRQYLVGGNHYVNEPAAGGAGGGLRLAGHGGLVS